MTSTPNAFGIENGEVLAQVRGGVGLLTLNRPKALNALSLQMVRDITQALLAWLDDDQVQVIAMRGMGKHKPLAPFVQEVIFGFSTKPRCLVILGWKIFSPRNTVLTI